jgi:hypothetical protein
MGQRERDIKGCFSLQMIALALWVARRIMEESTDPKLSR